MDVQVNPLWRELSNDIYIYIYKLSFNKMWLIAILFYFIECWCVDIRIDRPMERSCPFCEPCSTSNLQLLIKTVKLFCRCLQHGDSESQVVADVTLRKLSAFRLSLSWIELNFFFFNDVSRFRKYTL